MSAIPQDCNRICKHTVAVNIKLKQMDGILAGWLVPNDEMVELTFLKPSHTECHVDVEKKEIKHPGKIVEGLERQLQLLCHLILPCDIQSPMHHLLHKQ